MPYSINHASIKSASKEATYSKLLVLCIDRDNDIGSKGGIDTPIVGRDACINAGTRLAPEDPEDADSNAIFGAVKIYEELVSKGYETILPVIQSRIPVISVRRVIIRHSRSVEYSYAVLGRYLRMLVYDSQYSKFFLGVPGILLAAGALAVIFDAAKWITAIVLAILGGAFIVRAFDIDKALSSFGRLTPTSFIKIFSIIGGVLIILAAIANGISSIPSNIITPEMSALDIVSNRTIVGRFADSTITLLWIGIATILGGVLLSDWFKGSSRIMSDILRLTVLALLYIPLLQFTSVLTAGTNPFTLISSLLIGLAVSLVAATVLYYYFRNRKGGEVLKH